MRLIFAGTPEFAATSLAALIATDHEIVGVYTQPDRGSGRGRKITHSPVKVLALEHELRVLQPETLRDEQVQAELAALAPDLMIVVAYGLILPQGVLDTPGHGCINVHASLLPRWRGAAPIQRAIHAGDQQTGVSIMQMEAGLDTGPVLAERSTPIRPTDTGAGLHDRLAELGAASLIETVAAIAAGPVIATPQDDTLVTYATKLDKSEAWLDWTRSAIDLDRQVRAFNPYPVAQTAIGERTLRVWQAEPDCIDDPDQEATPGTVLGLDNSGILVACGEGCLRVQRLQFPGRRPISVAEWLNAGRDDIEVGTVLTGPV